MKDKDDDKTIDAFEKKAMTPAERKAKEREKNKDKARINCYISKEGKRKLDELRGKYFSIEQMLEKLIDEEYREIEDNPMLKLSPSAQRDTVRKMAVEDQAHYDSLKESDEERRARLREFNKPKLRNQNKKNLD